MRTTEANTAASDNLGERLEALDACNDGEKQKVSFKLINNLNIRGSLFPKSLFATIFERVECIFRDLTTVNTSRTEIKEIASNCFCQTAILDVSNI